MRELKFRAREFGTWLSDNDRQASIDISALQSVRLLSDLVQIVVDAVELLHHGIVVRGTVLPGRSGR